MKSKDEKCCQWAFTTSFKNHTLLSQWQSFQCSHNLYSTRQHTDSLPLQMQANPNQYIISNVFEPTFYCNMHLSVSLAKYTEKKNANCEELTKPAFLRCAL